MAENWVTLAAVSPAKTTPMVRQYLEAKAECPDSLLFFRMGDFYELFFEDALEAATLLGLSLTSRDGAEKSERIPMCGVPFRTVDAYVAKVIKAGRTVTICDQIEDPRDAKGIVKRAVVRTVTPGTVMEPDLLEERANNYLTAVMIQGVQAGLAFVDVTTGEFLVAHIEHDLERTLHDELTRMAPVELLAPEELESALIAGFPNLVVTRRPSATFDAGTAADMLQDLFGLGTLKGVGLHDVPQAAACVGALLKYVRETQRDTVPHLQLPRRYSPAGYVVLDGNTQRNLELVESLVEKSKRGTLLGVLDKTLTSMGGRMLRQWILHPLLDITAIQNRHAAVEVFFDDSELRQKLRELLQGMGDLERLLGRLTARSGNARDMAALGRSLQRLPGLHGVLAQLNTALINELRTNLDPCEDLAEAIARAIVDEPPMTLNEGNLIRDGFDETLDHYRQLVRGGRDWIATLQRDERERTGISTLKVGYNRVFGYFIEVSKGNRKEVPADYERKQTLANAERYITPALKEREEEILNAQERMNALEYDLFSKLREHIATQSRRIHAAANVVAAVDVLASFAEVAIKKNYGRPEINDSGEIRVRDGRHPVVEDLMGRNSFVPNDTVIGPAGARLHIVTGPNMAGKSTYLRQVALITLLAQIGSYVPAATASIGVVDRIFTRVGASDNLVRGESTFMVEMIETANILNTATERSLLVLDELGRGTSTYDGISIAWAVAEYLHDKIRAKTLFATHYHELTQLGTRLEHAKNVNVAVREWGEKVIFLYRIVEGGADHSYGIQVARLAGLPADMIKRAREILEALEEGNLDALGLPQQLYLFGPKGPSEPTRESAVEKELAQVELDTLTPRQAQEFLYHLKALLNR